MILRATVEDFQRCREPIALPGSAECRGFEGTPPIVAVIIDLIQWCQPTHIILHIWLETGEAQDHKEPREGSGVSAESGTIFVKPGSQLWDEGFDHWHQITGGILLSQEEGSRQDRHRQLATEMG